MTILAGQTSYQPERLVQVGHTLLDTVVDVFATAGVELPSRQFITVSSPVYDCEQLVVSFAALAKGVPGNAGVEAIRCNGPQTATFIVHLVRCFPTPTGRGTTPPTPQVLTDSADDAMVDAWLLMDSADAYDANPLHGYGGLVVNVAVGEPSGGYVGVVMTVEMLVV